METENAHVHPLFAETLNKFAAQAGLVRCRVSVKTGGRGDYKYEGIFNSTCAAVIDAQNREKHPCGVVVIAIK